MTDCFKRLARLTTAVAIMIIAATVAAVAAPKPAASKPAAKKTAAKKTDDALVLERANSNENVYSAATGEFISYLRGDVVFRFEDMRIRSDEATWQKAKGIVDFKANVKVEQNGQVMTCDRLHFVRDNNLLTAKGKVNYQDSAKITFMRGDDAEYRTDTKVATLWGNPLLTRADTSGGDTLFIRGRTMSFNDSTKIATVTDAVNIRRGSLTATCRKADYHTEENLAKMRVRPVIIYEKHRVIGDSIDLLFGDEVFKGAHVMGNAYGYSREIADSTKDTTITNIWSDSLYLSMFETGKMEAMKAFGSARGTYSEASASGGGATTTNLKSDSLHVFMFEETGKIQVIKAFGGAKCDYAEATAGSSGGKMTANITGDSLHTFMFETGKIRSLQAFGNSRAIYTETFASGSTSAMDIKSDSMRVTMRETGKVRAMRAFGSTHGRSAEWGTNANDSMITHIWSDSLRVQMSETGKIRTMKAFVDVKSLNFMLADSSRANEITGQTMTLAFDDHGRIGQALVRGGANSLYYLDEEEGGGFNSAGGDLIHVVFAGGKPQRLRVRGNVKGHYVP